MTAPHLAPTPPLLRSALVPLALVLAFAAIYWVKLKLWVVLVLVSPLLLLYGLAPRWARASAVAFDRDALRLRATGKRDALLARYRRALGLRLFAPEMASAERLAEVLRETGDAKGARREYQRALTAAGNAPTLSMMVGLAHSAYAAREDGHAIAAYRRLLERDAALPLVRERLAHVLLRRAQPGDVEAAIELLDASSPSSPERTNHAALRAMAAARRGKRADARAVLASPEGVEPQLLDELRELVAR